jgi:hypothetical protein
MPIEPPVPVRVLEALRVVLADVRSLSEADRDSLVLRDVLEHGQRCEEKLTEYVTTTSTKA